VLKNKVLSKTFGAKKVEAGRQMKMSRGNDELPNVYNSPSIVSTVKPKRYDVLGMWIGRGRQGMNTEFS